MLDYIKKIAGDVQGRMKIILGVNTIFYGRIPHTLLGDMWIATGKDGLVAVDFDMPESEFIRQTEKLSGKRLVTSEEEVKEIAAQILAYLDGNSQKIHYPVDLSNVSKFQRAVLVAVAEIQHGQMVTYGEIARIVGKPKASQAVGQALRRNPVPIAIPCHRVINADGTLGGYGGRMGIERKIKLLKLEGSILT